MCFKCCIFKPALLLLDEPSNHSKLQLHGNHFQSLIAIIVDLNALAWLEDYLQTWAGTILVVCVPSAIQQMPELTLLSQISRSCIPVSLMLPLFITRIYAAYHRDAVATDIVHQHSARLDYYKGQVTYPNQHT